MSIVKELIPNLINGISQQPYFVRLPSQCEFQENAYPHVVDGLTKSPATRTIAKLADASVGKPHVHTIKRDLDEKYKVMLMDGEIKVFDLEGNEKTVATPDGTDYLTGITSPRQDLEALTVADYTFILNKKKQTALLDDLSPTRTNEALVFIKAVGYVVGYTIKINGTEVASYTTNDDVTTQQKTDFVANELSTQLSASGYSNTRYGSVIHITHGSPFTISGIDTQSDTFMTVVKDKARFLSELPVTAPNGFVLEIVGDEESAYDNYYVEFKTFNGNSFDKGAWEETVKSGIKYKLDPSTMPHSLVRESDGSFTFKELEWGDRVVGDLESSPDPTFVGRKINEIFFQRDRLCFLSDENVVTSRASEFFEFFRSTVLVRVDNDPIDKAASDTKVVILKNAIPFNNDLLLFSEEAQFTLQAGNVFSQETVSIDPFTSFECDLKARPVNTGKTIQFNTRLGKYSGVKEFFVQSDVNITDTAEISKHCPRYIPQNIFKIVSSSNEDITLFLSEEEENRIYMYKFYWANNEKQQSAWGHLKFSDNAKVLDADFIASDCYLIMEYPDGVYLEKMKFDVGRVDPGLTFEYCLHRKIDESECESITYNASTLNTTIVLPYTPDAPIRIVTRGEGEGETSDKTAGTVATIVSQTGNEVVIKGDFSSTLFFVGQDYTMTYRFSTAVYKKRTGPNSSAAATAGRLNITRWYVNYSESGFFKAVVKTVRRSIKEKIFSGIKLGTISSVVGEALLDSGSFSFKVGAKSDKTVVELVNDSHMPCRFTSAGWEGIYSERGR